MTSYTRSLSVILGGVFALLSGCGREILPKTDMKAALAKDILILESIVDFYVDSGAAAIESGPDKDVYVIVNEEGKIVGQVPDDLSDMNDRLSALHVSRVYRVESMMVVETMHVYSADPKKTIVGYFAKGKRPSYLVNCDLVDNNANAFSCFVPTEHDWWIGFYGEGDR